MVGRLREARVRGEPLIVSKHHQYFFGLFLRPPLVVNFDISGSYLSPLSLHLFPLLVMKLPAQAPNLTHPRHRPTAHATHIAPGVRNELLYCVCTVRPPMGCFRNN